MNNLALLTFSKLNQCGLWVDPNFSLQNLFQSKGWYLVSCSMLNMFNSSPQLDLENKNSTVRWMTIRQSLMLKTRILQ